MVKVVLGPKGFGKTKALIENVNSAQKNTKGSVICIEKGSKLIFDIDHKVRLIDSDQYGICDYHYFMGFVAALVAQNHDITDIFVDSIYKIAGNDEAEFAEFLEKLDAFSKEFKFNAFITVSAENAGVPESIRKFY